LIADGFGEIRTLSLPREKFLELGGFPVGKKIGEDLHFVIRLCAVSKRAGVVNIPLAIYYIYPTSALRKNILESQKAFVETLDSLTNEVKHSSKPIVRGLREKLRRARLSLAYVHLREGRKTDAFMSVFPSFFANPSPQTFRDTLSVLKGMPSQK
jgi:hypothetical protein